MTKTWSFYIYKKKSKDLSSAWSLNTAAVRNVLLPKQGTLLDSQEWVTRLFPHYPPPPPTPLVEEGEMYDIVPGNPITGRINIDTSPADWPPHQPETI